MKRTFFILIVVVLVGAGCSQNTAVPPTNPPVNPELIATAVPPTTPLVNPEPITTAVPPTIPTLNPELVATAVPPDTPQETALTRPYGYTYQQPDGNRIVAGQGNLANLTPIDIPLDGAPAWVTAVPLARGVLWGVILSDGRTQAFLVDAGEITPIDSNDLPPNVPRVMTVNPQQGQALFLNPPAVDPSSQNPVIINAAGQMAFSAAAGKLFLLDENGLSLDTPAVTLLPDARILFAENGRLLFLTDPTDRYPHGVLGDSLEAASITLVETAPVVRIASQIIVSEPQVVEGIMPLWVDWNGDGRREIIVTLSDANQGAQINLFSENGQLLAQGPAIGQGSRWRHQIAIAPFGPNGELELAAVLTPHIGGVVEFYQWRDDELQIVAQLPGYTSHVINSSNMDMALAGDFDGNGRVELLLPNQERTQLGGIQRTQAGAEAAYHLDIGGQVITNLAGVTLAGAETPTGGIAVGLGRADNILRIWQP